MDYKFYKKTISTTGTTYYMVESETSILCNLDFTKRNFHQIKEIIDGIERSKTLPKGEEYYWGNEAVDLYSNENGLLLVDNLAQRAKQYDPDVITLRLTHDEMKDFLKDFKKFVEENS